MLISPPPVLSIIEVAAFGKVDWLTDCVGDGQTREKRTTKMEQSGMSQEELEAAQRALFQQATEKYNQGPGD